MKCFFYFRNKNRSRHQTSAPELKEQQESDFSGCSRTAASLSSLTSPRSVPELYEEKAHNLRVFSFTELRQATHDFNRLLKIGQGGFGSVFKGSIKPVDGKGEPLVVAIKQLSKDGLQVRIFTLELSAKGLFECFALNLMDEFLHIICIQYKKSSMEKNANYAKLERT